MNELAQVLGYGVLFGVLVIVLIALSAAFIGGLDASNGKFTKAADFKALTENTRSELLSLQERVRRLEPVTNYAIPTVAYGYEAACTAFAADNKKKAERKK